MLPLRGKGILGAVVLLWVAAGGPLSAQHQETIEVVLNDVEMMYLGTAFGGEGALFNSPGNDGGESSASAKILAATFTLGGALQGALASPSEVSFGDFKINGVGATLALNRFQSGLGAPENALDFDWYTPQGDKLQLVANSIKLVISPTVLFFSGEAEIVEQNLPFSLAFDASQPVQFSYTARLPTLGSGSPIDRAAGSGALKISGLMAIPEPASAMLLIMGALFVLARRQS